MKINDLNKCFESIKPSDEHKEKMLYNILSSRNTVKRTSFIFKNCFIAFAVIVSVAGLSVAYSNINKKDNIAANINSSIDLNSNNGYHSDDVVDKVQNFDNGYALSNKDENKASEKSAENNSQNKKSSSDSTQKRNEESLKNKQEYNKAENAEKKADEDMLVAKASQIESDSSKIARDMLNPKSVYDYESDATVMSEDLVSDSASGGGACMSSVLGDSDLYNASGDEKAEEEAEEEAEEDDGKEENKNNTDEEDVNAVKKSADE